MKNKKILIAAAFLAALAAYFLWPKNNQAAQNSQEVKPIDVTVITINKKIVRPLVELPGRVNAQKISHVRPQIDGIVKEVKFTEGSFVKKGQPLYLIDPAIYKSAVAAATSNAKTLRDKRDRYKILVDQDAVSRQEFSDVEAAYLQAKAEVARTKKNLDYTKVLAPISGFIGKTNVTEGALATANQAIIMTTITQVDPIYVDLEQASKDVISTSEEILVNITTDDPTYQNVGKLKFHEMFADETTDSVRLRAIFKNADHKLLPGMFVTAKLDLPEFEAITVPQKVTSRGPDGNLMVWVVTADNSVTARPIKAERISGDSWIVDSGLNEGDVVIYEGILKVHEGSKVNPIDLASNQQNQEEVK